MEIDDDDDDAKLGFIDYIFFVYLADVIFSSTKKKLFTQLCGKNIMKVNCEVIKIVSSIWLLH